MNNNGIASIMHISDLHRSPKEEISNAALLSSLISDNDKYTTDEPRLIKSPDLIVVSGDIIRGSIKTIGSDQEIKHQYKEAEELLISICEKFLNGERSKMVIIPGNHDMDWNYSKASMTKMDKKKVFERAFVQSYIHEEMVKSQSAIRFSWKDFSCYEITDRDIYNKRMAAFADFYNSFYSGKRAYSLNPEEQYEIFDYEEFDITIAAFNSCFGNDHLRLAGDINPVCIAKANTDLLSYKRNGRLIVATWHHNTKGGVYDMNFMNSSKLKNFIDSGVSLGLHGHQHKNELIYEYSNAFEQKKIVVFSAGTLCGGRQELPTGTTRQYNIIEINRTKVEKVEVTLHVREKTEGSSFQNPVWQPGRIPDTLESCITILIDKPKSPPVAVSLVQVEKLIRSEEFDQARMILERLDISQEPVRYYWRELIEKTDNADVAFQLFLPPKTIPECLTILGFSLASHDRETQVKCLNAAKKFNSGDPSIKHLLQKLEALIR